MVRGSGGPVRTILMIGDSLTYVNDMDKRLRSLGLAAGVVDSPEQLVVERVVKGGAPLSRLWRRTKAKQAVKGGVGWATRDKKAPVVPWDLVIVQEDLPETDLATFRLFARKFHEVAAAAGSAVLFLATWSYDRLATPPITLAFCRTRLALIVDSCDVEM